MSGAVDIVVSFDYLPKIGGAHRWLHEVYSRWPRPVRVLTRAHSLETSLAQSEVEFDALAPSHLSIHRQVQRGGPVNLLSGRYLADLCSQIRAIACLSDGKSVCLHALKAFPEGVAAAVYKAAHPQKARLVTYAHGEEILVAQRAGQLRLAASRVYRMSDLVIANSEYTRALVAEICPGARTACIHPGVDVEAFARAAAGAAEYRATWPWPPDAVVASTVARMEARKNQASVLRAIAALRIRGVPVAYLCAGDGEEREGLVSLAQELNLGPWVSFPGPVSEREKELIFCACDIHIMPSVRVGSMVEGFGIVFLEAAAAGKPSICGNVGGQCEAVLAEKTGLVVDGRAPEQVESAIERLATDTVRRDAMGVEALSWARTHDWKAVAARTFELVAGLRLPTARGLD